MPLIRLDKFFSSQEIISRKDIKSYIKKGHIKVNNEKVSSQSMQINTDNDIITLFDDVIPFKPFLYIMLNKPIGVVSATNDKLNSTVLDLVPDELFRSDLFPAGRLDKDSTGFVLITNDGDFAHKILSPKNHVPKTYIVRVDGKMTKEATDLMENGITLASGEVCKPAIVKVLDNTDNALLEVIIVEGKYHQIKRMLGVVDLGVLSLQRKKIGELELDINLQEGECREILHKELTQILVN